VNPNLHAMTGPELYMADCSRVGMSQGALGLLLFSRSGRAAQRALGAAQALPTPLGWAGTGTLATWSPGQVMPKQSFGPSYRESGCELHGYL
jgi:hypothetical protein